MAVDGCCGGEVAGGLEPRTAALVRLATIVALGSSSACYVKCVRAAVELGATVQQVIDTMTAVASTVGMARLVSATPRVALGLGYDVEAAFEAVDPDDRFAERETSADRAHPAVPVSPDQEELLRRLSLSDAGVTGGALGAMIGDPAPSSLDGPTLALARVAALVASDAALPSYQWAVDSALAAGAGDRDIVDVLVAVAPAVGLARAVAAAPELALALGYDLESPAER